MYVHVVKSGLYGFIDVRVHVVGGGVYDEIIRSKK
jgi:hypothetical protein